MSGASTGRLGLLAAVLLVATTGCLPDAPGFACGADGVTPRCTTPGSECRAGYCAVRAAECASGWRYTESAAAPGVCVPPSSVDAGGDVQAVDDGMVSDRPLLDDVPADAGFDAPLADLGVDAPATDAGNDLGAADVHTDTGPDLATVDAGRDVPSLDAALDAPGADAPRPDVGVGDVGGADVVLDLGRPDTGTDAGIDAGIDAGPSPPGPVRLLEPIVNARVRGDRLRFRARVGTPSRDLPLRVRVYGPDCRSLSATTLDLLAPSYEAVLTLAPGIHCYDVVRGSETVVSPRRVLMEGGTLDRAPPSLAAGFLSDFDRSGMADVLVGRAGGAGAGDVATPILFDANRMPSSVPSLAPPGTGSGVAALRGWYAGDLDNDGYGDAVVLYRVGINGEAWLQLIRYRGGPAGLEVLGDPLASVREADASGYALAAGAVADLDDDGIGELVLVHGAPTHGVELRTSRRGFTLVGDVTRVDGAIALAAVLPPTAAGVGAAVAWAGTRLSMTVGLGVVEYRGLAASRVDLSLSELVDRTRPAAVVGGFDAVGTSYSDFAFVVGSALRVVHFDPAAASGQGAYVLESSPSIDPVFDLSRLVGVGPVTRFAGGRDVVLVFTTTAARAYFPGGRTVRSDDTYAPPVTALGTTALGQQGSLLVARPVMPGATVNRLFRIDLNDNGQASAAPLGIPAALAPLWLSR